MYAEEVITKGAQLQHITAIDKQYWDKDVKVIILFGEQAYDMENDPERITTDVADEAAYQQAIIELKQGEAISLADAKQRLGYA